MLRFAAPTLMAGNVGILKHASNVPQSALAIAEVFTRAGFPEGCFQTLLVGSAAVAKMIDDPRIAAVTLTGSEGAGVAVGRAAGAQIKKAVLELGGSDPFIVLPSADLAKAAATAVKARTINNGQSCIAAKRFIVHEAVYERFATLFVGGMAALVVGDPMDPATEIGPLATAPIRDELAEQVERSVAAGAKLLLGGRALAGPGNFYAADGARRSGARLAGLGRRALRPGGDALQGGGSRRRDRARQPHGLRPRRLGLDAATPPSRSASRSSSRPARSS